MNLGAGSRVFAVAALGSAAGFAGILRWAPQVLSGRAETMLMALVFLLWPLLYAVLVGWRMRPVRPLLVAMLGGALFGHVVLPAAEVHVWRFVEDLRWVGSAVLLLGELWVLWLLGEYRAILLRPVSMDARWLYLRYGLLGDECIPVHAIATVQPWTQRLPRRAGLIQHRAGGRPNVRLILRSPISVTRLSGDATVDAILLALDDPVTFSRTLTDRLSRAA